MTSEEFRALVDEYGEDASGNLRDLPMREDQVASLEGSKGIVFPDQYKEFLVRYGAGEFGTVTILSPDPKSQFGLWESAVTLENRECTFIGVVEVDSDYYGFLVEHGIAANDIWRCDHDFEYEVVDTDYADFFSLLCEVALGLFEEEE